MKNYIRQNEFFLDFPSLINAVEKKYTLPYKEACRRLKCSRSWAQTYIRPNVPAVYLSNGIGTGRENYAKLVSKEIQLRKGNLYSSGSNESIYLDEAAFNTFIIESVVRCEKRSKKVCRSYFIEEKEFENYFERMLESFYIYFNEKNRKKIMESMKSTKRDFLNFVKNPLAESIIFPNIVTPFARKEAEFVEVPFPKEVPISEWKAVHDMLDYGDVEETIYRRLFFEGNIRVELKLPDKDGVIKNSGKVYYIDDPNPVYLPENYNKIFTPIVNSFIKKHFKWADKSKMEQMIYEYAKCVEWINVSQSAWILYNEKMDKVRNATILL